MGAASPAAVDLGAAVVFPQELSFSAQASSTDVTACESPTWGLAMFSSKNSVYSADGSGHCLAFWPRSRKFFECLHRPPPVESIDRQPEFPLSKM